jgi:hypothetical protein
MDDMVFRTMRTLCISVGMLFVGLCVAIVLEVSIPQVLVPSEFGPPVPGRVYDAGEMQARDAAAAGQLAAAQEILGQEKPTLGSFTHAALVRFQWPIVVTYLVVVALIRRASPSQQLLAAIPFVALIIGKAMSLWLVPGIFLVASSSAVLHYRKNRAVGT